MTDQFKFGSRLFGSIALIAALTVGTVAASNAQTMRQQNGAYTSPPEQLVHPNTPPAVRSSVAEAGTPCGGDFAMLGRLEEALNDLAEANPCEAPVCD